MYITASLVSWPELVKQWHALHGKSAEGDSFFFDARDDPNQTWVVDHDLWFDNPKMSSPMGDAYAKVRQHLEPTARMKLDRIFGLFFWLDHEVDGKYTYHSLQELSPEADPEIFAMAMRPSTVREYLSLWDPTAFEQLRQPFEAEYPKGVGDLSLDFAQFKKYAEMWVELLTAAAAEDRGLVLTVI
jgi:hypothetical protein